MLQFDKSITFNNKEIDVFTIGELLVDMISNDYDDDFNCSEYTKHFGGSPANIAMNVKRLGANSAIYAAVGEDGLGNYLINNLKSNKIDTSYINKVKHSTSMVLVSKSKKHLYQYFTVGLIIILNIMINLVKQLKAVK